MEVIPITGARTFVDKRGYLRFRDSHRFVHRWMIEKHLGRKLAQGEVVHHLNGNKLDNDISNLMVFLSQHEHHRWHFEQKIESGVW